MHWVGFDVGKAFHWVCVLDGEGDVVLSKRVEASEERIEEALSEISGVGTPDERVVGIDILGGPATLLEALLLARGERVCYLPGTVVNRARDAYAGGERKSDPGDAFVIADQVRMRWRSLSEVHPKSEDLEEVRVLVGHRADLVQERVRRITRLRGLLTEVFPGMEAALDFRKQGPLLAVTRVATPTAARRLGKARLARWLKARGALKAGSLAERVVDAAHRQRHETPAAGVKATLVAELASEVLRIGKRLDELDARLEELVEADPRGAVVRSLPGMGLVLTAEFLAEVGDAIGRFGSADRMAAAAGIVPVLRSSGSLSYQRRAKKGNRALKRIFYRSAFCALACEGRSRDYYLRKRAEGKGAQQAIIALARRRVNVLWAMLRDGRRYEDREPAPA
ncbi:MAG: IS110 family transposase [Actinomycetota bacterium]|nr:IS110 family transposase [Actinomycetota bacterium]